MEGKPGALSIATRLRLDHRIDLGGGERVPTIAIDVSDTGSGIPDAVKHQVMTPFFTTKPRGTGLGLALSRHFVALHGGALHVESAEGQGTTVRVSLPLRRAS
jgi:signal transduction histidine kinase